MSDVKIILAPNKTLRGSLAGGNTLKGGIFVGGSGKLDTTLTQSGMAADAKAVGDALARLGDGGVSDYPELTNKPKINGVELSGNKTSADLGIGNPTNEQVASSVEAWLDAHPEATTTVADGSINPDKTTWMRQVWHNILDVSASDEGSGFYSASAATTGNASCSVSAAIPVIAGAVYRVVNIGNIRWLDASNACIGTQANKTLADRFETAPDGAAYAMMQYVTANAAAVQVHEYMGEAWEYDTYKNLYAMMVTDAGYSKAIADLVEEKFVDGSLAPVDLFADESLLYKQMKGWGEFHWNIVDPSTIEEGQIDANGADKESGAGFTYYVRSGYVPVTPGEKIHFMWLSCYAYDADKNFVCEIVPTTYSGVVPIPDGVYFLRFTAYGNSEITSMGVYRRGYGKHDLMYSSSCQYEHGFPVFKDEDSKEGFKVYLGIHPWADKNFGIIGDSFTAPGIWVAVMCDNLKAASRWNHAVSGANFGDADGVPKTAYEQAQEMVANGNTPDVILITMGTNDANNSRTIGEIVESNSIPDFDLTTYTGGMQACLNYLQANFPDAIIYVGWTPMGGLDSNTKPEYLTRMQEVCLMYGVEYIETRTCGVTRFSDVYAECYENGANGGHPTGAGQQKIGAYMTRLMKSKL